MPPFTILIEDEHLVAISKPCNLLVHRTNISQDTQFVLQLLRHQLRQRIYPVHRLDRPTSGVLLFGKNKEAGRAVSMQFQEGGLKKNTLLLFVAGWKQKEQLTIHLRMRFTKLSIRH